MNFTKRILLLVSVATYAATLTAGTTDKKSASELRLVAANNLLKADQNEIAIYTKGAICSSCGIGIRIILSKMDGVDKKKYKKGVFIDTENQLTVLALEEGVEFDIDAIFQAIYDAGYDPVYYFRHNGKVVERIEYALKSEE